MRRGEQAVNDSWKGIRRWVGEERTDLLGRRRQPDQVEGDAADERAAVGPTDRPQSDRGPAGGDEPIDRTVGPAGRVRRGIENLDRLERPMPRAGYLVSGESRRRSAMGCGPGRAVGDPTREVRDGLAAQPLLRRHLDLVVGPADRLDDQALIGFAGDHCRPTIAALEECLSADDRQSAAGLLAPVARKALGRQDGPDLQFEEGIGPLVGPSRADRREHAKHTQGRASNHDADSLG